MLYTIGDLHLSSGSDKPMDVFGGGWIGYTEKLVENFSKLNDDDLCVICGDISWAMDLESALDDFKLIDSFPGKKIILKGNHDYWWNTASKINRFFKENDIKTISILHNNCYFYSDDVAICGTRGWFYDQCTQGEGHDKKIMARELGRLEASLKAAGNCRNKLCFLHYPPRFGTYICHELIEILKKYGVENCWYGHIHGHGIHNAVNGNVENINYKLVSADYLNFIPLKISINSL